MSSVEEVLLAYARAWNEPDETKRRELVQGCWAEDGAVVAPQQQYAGREALLRDMAAFQRHYPGYRAVLTSGPDGHHGLYRFSVAVLDPDGDVVTEGLDIAQLAPDGRLARVITFWGGLPAVPPGWPPRLTAARGRTAAKNDEPPAAPDDLTQGSPGTQRSQ